MEDQLISFETARLAKEKFFRIPTLNYFRMWYNEVQEKHYDVDKQDFNQTYHTLGENEEYISRPTQSLLSKWLREEYQIYIQPHLIEQFNPTLGWGYELTYFDNYEMVNTDEDKAHDSYEDALEEALQKALKLIK